MILDAVLAPARWLADRAWFALARRVLPAVDDNLVDVGEAPTRYLAVGVPRRLDIFDGHAIGQRLDRDVVR
jgi:hypothetical protein